MPLLKLFKQFIHTENLFSTKDRLLIAVSGGVDSVVLCELCKQAGFDFAMAHCNFKLRKEESDGDERFVTALAKKYKATFFVQHFATEAYAQENKVSIQVAARELRYHWFNQLIMEPANGLQYILTAHHVDDDIETILMNFFKGTGINGLKGILPKQQRIIRPLLFASKEQILVFAKAHRLDYREDSSNSSDKYTRNYFRNQLIPEIEKVFPQVKENLLHNADRFKDLHALYQTSITRIKKGLIVQDGDTLQLPVLKLLKTEALHSVLYEIIKDFGFTSHQTGEVKKLLHSDSGKFIESATHRILRNRKWLLISALQNIDNKTILIKEEDQALLFSQGKINISKTEKLTKIENDPTIAQLNMSDIQFPLLLRKWKTGDYFYPLGMSKKKKLSRFFIDQKMSLNEKEKIWVIESNKKIIWVVGKRIDNRFKIDDHTSMVMRIELIVAS